MQKKGNCYMNNLKMLRLQAGMTVRKLGEITNIAFGSISMIENGMRPFTEENLIILSDYFSVTTDYLLGRSPYHQYSKDQSLSTIFLHELSECEVYLADDQKSLIIELAKMLVSRNDRKL